MTKRETSIVIRAFNEERHLPRLLEAIKQQAYRDFEVIVVDSGSFDGTPEIALRYGARLLRIASHDFTFGYSLNAGIRGSQGWYIVIVSAHALPLDSSWLGGLIDPLRDPSVAMVYGRQLGTPTSKFSELQDFRRMFGPERVVLPPRTFLANNANSAIRKDLWEQHPFDEALPGLEDIEWTKHWMEHNHRVVYEPQSAIYHIHEESWRQVRRRYYREALAAKWIGIKRRIHIPQEMLSEGKNLTTDLIQAGWERCLIPKLTEIVLFRFNKTVGMVQGILDGAAMSDPRQREAMFFDNRYKAVVIHGPGHATLKEVELPEIKPGDVLIKVAYVGVCATDLEIFEGSLGYYSQGVAKYPITPGHEFSGRIARVGSNVKHLYEGDPVVIECVQTCTNCEECRRGNQIGCRQRKEVGVIDQNGAYAEYVITPGHFVHKLPQSEKLKKAALCEPIAVVLKGLNRLQRTWGPGERKTCAVVGAGPIGHLCARILSLRGHRVRVFDRNPLRLGLFKDSAIETSDKMTGLNEFEAVVEVTGDPGALQILLHESGPGAILLLLGFPYGKREFNFEGVVANDKVIVGSVGSNAPDFEQAIRLLPELNLDAFLQKEMPLSEYRAAWETSRSRHFLKVLLAVDPMLDDRP